MERRNKGKVYLIGAGPGDPKLITVRGLEALGRADAVVYDRLANPRLLRHTKPGAEKIFVGKQPDKHMLKQEEINRLLADLALAGKSVARLKGGDPSVFGRAGEEAEMLAQCGIDFEIIPGVTSAIAAPIYAGIPVTHRDFTSSFSIVTGHEYPNKTYSSVNYENLAGSSGTLIFLMGVANIGNIAGELMRWGKPPETPVALIRWGTWMEQRTLTGTLADIAGKVRQANFQSPAVIIVGEVVRLREKIAWFEKKPLFGCRILVTRARSQASELADGIDEMGGEAVEFPVIRLREAEGEEAARQWRQAVEELEQYRWLLFTSANGVEFFFRRLREEGLDIRRLAGAKVASVGPKTSEALRERGIMPDLEAATSQQEGLFAELRPHVRSGDKVLLPTSSLARENLFRLLEELGAVVNRLTVYENVPSTEYGEEVLELLREGAIHIVTFTSSSTVTNLLQSLRELGEKDPVRLLRGVRVACIGPVTRKTAEEAGLAVHYTAERPAVASLLEAIASASDAPAAD
jgi:uroporphyrinogen III methyltransferase/synthase